VVAVRLPEKLRYSAAYSYNTSTTPPSVRGALKRILLEGVPAELVLRIMGTFVTPFAVALKATSLQVGLLSALPNLFGSLVQLLTPNLVSVFGSRKRLFMVMLPLSGVVWIPIAVLPWVFSSAQVWWLLGLVTLAFTLFLLPSPAWGSWVGQLLPVERRGRFLGARLTLASLIGVLAVLGLGQLLDLMHNRLFVGFSGIFFGMALLRFISALLLRTAYEPPVPEHRRQPLNLLPALKGMVHTNLGRFVAINAMFQFSVCLAGPFFIVLMLRDLHFSYTTIILLQLVNTIAAMAGMQVWGVLADKKGNMRVLRITAPLIGVMTFGWFAYQAPWWLACVETLGGLSWAGYNIASINFVYESSTDEERARNVSLFSALAGVGIFAGSIVGGILAPVVPTILSYSLLSLILASAVLRFAIGVFVLPAVKEVRGGGEEAGGRRPAARHFIRFGRWGAAARKVRV
jgi:MFS family permease